MPPLRSLCVNNDAIRQHFIDFFVQRGHLQLPSLTLLPTDPSVTTLFTIAGMQQMIAYFLGREEPPSRRLVTVQRAIRTNDIGEVGDDSHLTFLEMLGNFSVGDYFKAESIAFTWEFLTKTMGIPPDRWWATIYPGDDEARNAWLAVGMPPDRIGETEENWWAQGPVGPCGPDSEIHYDRGTEYSCGVAPCRPENECCERFIETWNNVFMVYFQEESGERRSLPWSNIDTGMGFERLTMIVQGAESVYDTDLFQPIIRVVTDIAGVQYRTDPLVDRSLRVISDHSRTITFLIADGVMPSAEGRGYVLRRLLRRATLHGRLLGISRPFLTDTAEAVITIMSGYYNHLVDRRQHIKQVIAQEERRFLQTLDRGLILFDELAARASATSNTITGRDAFVLYDTHGFPLELTLELATEKNLQVDSDGFAAALLEQQARSSAGRKFTHDVGATPDTYVDVSQRVEPTVFRGYDELRTPSEVVAIIGEGHAVARAESGDKIELVLAATPFYAESGGQVGDTGMIRAGNALIRVLDTQRPVSSLIVHKAEVIQGAIASGDAVEAEVDVERRLHIHPHHSGTHLLHKALQEVLGPEATQAGSLVAPDRLRFDFRWLRPLTSDEVREVQDRVNAAIWANLPVRREIMQYDDAIRSGAMALFGEKYGDSVRVVSMGDWSRELCGGTHVDATGDIGLLLIVSETGIGSGIRRIEALAGAAAYAYVHELRQELMATALALGTSSGSLHSRAEQVVRDAREQEKKTETLARQLAAREADALVDSATIVDGMTLVVERISAESADSLHATTDAVKSRLDRGIVVLGAVVDARPQFAMAVTSNLSRHGYSANKILRAAVGKAGGGAGGSAEFAQGGGRDPNKIDDVLQTAVELIKQAEG